MLNTITKYRIFRNSSFRQLFRFACVGASGAIVNLAVLVGLVRFAHFNVNLAYIIALEISILSNFSLNQRFTFRDTHKNKSKVSTSRLPELVKKLVRYNVVVLGGVAISWLVFVTLYHQFGISYSPYASLPLS